MPPCPTCPRPFCPASAYATSSSPPAANGWPSSRTGRPGLTDAVANFTPGVAAGLLLGWDVTAAVLLGGVCWVSSSGIVAKVLSDLDLRASAGPAILIYTAAISGQPIDAEAMARSVTELMFAPRLD